MTRISLAAGAAAAPLFTLVALAQAATRAGYDLTRHPVSMLALGDLGWVQTSSFVLTALLSIAAVPGARRALAGGAGATWAPRLLAAIGAGLLLASVFRMDPGDGFPVGTPLGAPTTMSWHMILHNVGGSLSFFSMIALCFVLARRSTADGSRRWAVAGRAAGLVFAVLLLWAMTGGRSGALTLFLGVVVAWGYISATLLRRTYGHGRGPARMSATAPTTKLLA